MIKELFLPQKMVPIITILMCVIVLSACNPSKEVQYYAEKTNYITVTGTVTHIKYTEDEEVLYLGFSNLSPSCDDDTFKIVGNNVSIVQEKGIDEKIVIDSQIEFITAPRYFGDGYVMPIVSLTVDGETLLEFEEGHSNLMEWLRTD